MNNIKNSPEGVFVFSFLILAIYCLLNFIIYYEDIASFILSREGLNQTNLDNLSKLTGNFNLGITLSYFYIGFMLIKKRYEKSKIIYITIEYINRFKKILGLNNLIK